MSVHKVIIDLEDEAYLLLEKEKSKRAVAGRTDRFNNHVINGLIKTHLKGE